MFYFYRLPYMYGCCTVQLYITTQHEYTSISYIFLIPNVVIIDKNTKTKYPISRIDSIVFREKKRQDNKKESMHPQKSTYFRSRTKLCIVVYI